MPSETSFIDRIQRGEKLQVAMSHFNPAYSPVDPVFSLSALSTAIAGARSANQSVDAARPPYQDEVTDRAALIKLLGPLVTQSLNYVKSNTAWAKRFDVIKDLADKVRGVAIRRSKASSPEPDKKVRNSGERSYAELASHLKRYIGRLEGLNGYAPPDEKISIPALTAQWTKLNDLNQSIPALAQTLTDAIADRQAAYIGATGLKFVFSGMKTSVKGQYGIKSAAYQAIASIRW